MLLLCSAMTRKDQLRLAFTYNFAKFISWPNTAEKSKKQLIITFIGKQPFGEKIKLLEKKTLRGKKVVVRQISDIKDLKTTHLLFICDSEKDNLAKILQATNKLPILTVSALANFKQNGGMIEFVNKGSKVHFRINNKLIKAQQLQISAELSKLALYNK